MRTSGKKPVTEVERPQAARRLGIGTVQFGQAYGISNRRGQVPLEDARAIVARAERAGVSLLDTAASYGEAEEVLAQMDTQRFRVVTKTIGIEHGVDAVVARARQGSVKTLGRGRPAVGAFRRAIFWGPRAMICGGRSKT